MEIEFYLNKCVLSNIPEKQDGFPPDKSIHHVIRFICPSQVISKGEIKLCKLVLDKDIAFKGLRTF